MAVAWILLQITLIHGATLFGLRPGAHDSLQAIKHFRGMIESYPLLLRTDHKPLVYAFNQKFDSASLRQLRQLKFIAHFSIFVLSLL